MLFCVGGLSKANAEVSIQIEGNSHFTTAALMVELADEFAPVQTSGLDLATADDSAFFLELYYRSQGFPEVFVEYDIVDGGKTLLLKVMEGPMVR